MTIDEMYVTQVAQFSKYNYPPVQAKAPLVSGGQAEVRVFVISDANETAEKENLTRIRIYVGSTKLTDIAEPSADVTSWPTSIKAADELNVNKSYNALIPASMMTSGSLQVKAVALTDSGAESATATSTVTLDVRSISPLAVALVPLRIAGVTGITTPFPSVSSTTVPTVTVTAEPTAAGVVSGTAITTSLETARKAANYGGFYYGLLPDPTSDPTPSAPCGAALPITTNNGNNRIAFGADNATYKNICPNTLGDEHHIMPHELAHAFSADHAPCPSTGTAAPSDPDPWFKSNGEAGGHTKSDGWDFANTGTVPNGAKMYDVMSYCTPYWVSAYSWQKIANFFKTGPSPDGKSTNATTRNGDTRSGVPFLVPLSRDRLAIHESAEVGTDGKLYIHSGFSDFGSRFHDQTTGPAHFEGLDAKNRVLFSQDVQVIDASSTLRSGHAYLMSMDMPITAQDEVALDAIRVTYNGQSVTRRGLPVGPFVATARAIDSTTAHISFDRGHFEELVVGEAADGTDARQRVFGDIHAHDSEVVTSAAVIYATFENGIKTVARNIEIHVEGR